MGAGVRAFARGVRVPGESGRLDTLAAACLVCTHRARVPAPENHLMSPSHRLRAFQRTACLAAFFTLAALAGCGGSAPPGPPSGLTDLPSRSLAPPIFYVDTTSLVAEGAKTGVRITISAPFSQLPFAKRTGGGYEARFEIAAIFFDRSGRQVTGDVWRHQATTERYKDTQSNKKTFNTHADFTLPPGEYSLEVSMSTIGQVSGSTATRTVYVAPLSAEGVQISAIEIGTCADSLAGLAAPGATAFTTSLTRRFGDPLPHVCLRGEVFARGALAGESVAITLSILGPEDRVETMRVFTLAMAGERSEFLARVPVDSLGPGTYRAEIAAVFLGKEGRAAREFEIDASRIDIERNYEDYVTLAGYYLGDEAAVLRGVPPGERRARWDEFWKERDPDPATPENERLEEFIARVRVAADRYPERGRPGWGTDRGKVYIRYGEPNDVEQVPSGFNTPAYEIWRYTERNLTFVFADTGGFGEYVLVQPSSPF